MEDKLLRSLVWLKDIKEGLFLRYIKFETTNVERIMLINDGLVMKKGDMYYLTKKGVEKVKRHLKENHERKNKETVFGPIE